MKQTKMQINKRVPDPSRRTPVPHAGVRRFSCRHAPYKLLYQARTLLGVSRQELSAEMGIPNYVLRKYETGQMRIPASFLLKIFMFGLDFWTEGICWDVERPVPPAPAPDDTGQEDANNDE